MIAHVLDVVPDAVDAPRQLVADLLVLGDDVVVPAPELDPPVAGVEIVELGQLTGGPALKINTPAFVVGKRRSIVIAVFQIFLGETVSPFGTDELHRPAPVHRLEHQGIALRIRVGRFRSVGLVELRPALATDAGGRARQHAQRAVAGGVDEDLPGEGKARLGAVLEATHRADDATLGLRRLQAGIQVEVQPLLPARLLPHDRVPHREGVVGIAALVLQKDLQQDASLHHVGLAVVAVRPDDVHANLAAGVAAEHAAVLDQGNRSPVAGCGNGGAHARKSPADDDDLIAFFYLADRFHGCFPPVIRSGL